MARPKLSEEKQTLIRKRLVQGYSVKQIAEEVQVSEITVKRYKKNTPALFIAEQDTGDNSIKYDYTTSLTKKEEAFTKKIEKELALYEDDEEGWVYHISARDFRLKQSGMWWNFIVYPESAPEHWIDKLKVQGLRLAISPLHDKDTWNHDSPEMVNAETGEYIEKGARYKMGDRKKAHWHCIAVCDTRVAYREMNDLLRKITNCPYIQKCNSLKNSFNYFLHINAPNKYQNYDKEEIQIYNNFHIEPNKRETTILVMEMIDLIVQNDIVEWCDCVEFFKNDPEFSLLLSTRTAYFNAYVKSRYYKKYPNHIKYVETKTVNKFSFEKNNF